MKILVISLAGIGDTLLATPLIEGLRRAYPQAQIDALVMWSGAKQILEGNPHVNSIFQEDLIKAGYFKGLKNLARYRRERYDLSVNTFPQSKIIYRVTAWYIKARRRISHVHENYCFLDDQLLTDTVAQDYQIHCIENNLKILDKLGVAWPANTEPQLYFNAEDTAWCENFFRTNQLLTKAILGVHVGSGKTKNLMLKRWPVENYVAVLKQVLAALPEMVVLLFGGPEEKAENDIILAEIKDPRIMPVPSRNMKQAALALGRCDAFLSVDNAFMHLAATMKVPHQIVIESPTFNKTIEPYHRPFQLVSNPMVGGRNLEYYLYDGKNIRGGREHLLACMRSVTPEAVLAAVARALQQ